jgi:predicted nucleotidyltransferase component of viral defense system
MKWHEEVLDDDGLLAVRRLAEAVGRAFYLAGGTGLAVRFGHRVSLDLDLFSSENLLGQAERDDLIGALARSGPVRVLESKDDTCHLAVGKTMVSLFRYRYPLLDPTTSWKGLPVASARDIGAMKVSAIVGRGSKKDFLDLHAVCSKTGLSGVLAACERKFHDHRDFLMQAFRGLVYFEDADKEPMPRLLKAVSWDDLKAFFERETSRALRSRLERPRRRRE